MTWKAQSAITAAWDDNHTSPGVSRSIGYQPNGQYRHRRDDRDGDGVGSMIHLRLTHEDWLSSGAGEGARITGFEACRPYFGV